MRSISLVYGSVSFGSNVLTFCFCDDVCHGAAGAGFFGVELCMVGCVVRWRVGCVRLGFGVVFGALWVGGECRFRHRYRLKFMLTPKLTPKLRLGGSSVAVWDGK